MPSTTTSAAQTEARTGPNGFPVYVGTYAVYGMAKGAAEAFSAPARIVPGEFGFQVWRAC